MKISRYFTTAGQDPFSELNFEKRTSEIRNPNGTEVLKWKMY